MRGPRGPRPADRDAVHPALPPALHGTGGNQGQPLCEHSRAPPAAWAAILPRKTAPSATLRANPWGGRCIRFRIGIDRAALKILDVASQTGIVLASLRPHIQPEGGY